MIIKHFHISIDSGIYRSGLNALAIDDLLIIKSDLGEKSEAHIRLSRNTAWARLVARVEGDHNTVTVSESTYEANLRKVTALVVYRATGEVQLYAHGEIASGSYDMERRLCIRAMHFGAPDLD